MTRTFEQLYCERYHCDATHFRTRLFRATLPWHARYCALILGGFWGKYFGPERDLIASVGEATTMTRIREEIRDYFMDPAHGQWLRRRGGVRISTRRLQRIARQCGLAGASNPPFGSALSEEEPRTGHF